MEKQRRQSVSSSSLQIQSDFEDFDDLPAGVNRYQRVADQLVTLLMPDSVSRLTWETFIFMLIWYNSVMTSVRIFVMDGERTPEGLIVADIILDFIFVFDTIFHFYRPYIDKDTGRIVTERSQLRYKYVGSPTFFINMMACFPVLKMPLAPFFDAKMNRILSTNFNVLRMIRVLHFPTQFEELKRYLSKKDPVNDSVFRMGVILFFTQLLMCIFGCIYFGWAAATVEDVCPPSETFEETIINSETWIGGDFVITDVMDIDTCEFPDKEPACDSCPEGLFFVRSVYFLMQTLFTIGYGDSVVPSRSRGEVALACIFMLFGVFGYGLIIANMTSLLSNLDVVRMRFRYEMDRVNKWMDFRSVPAPLRKRIELFFSYLLRSQQGMLDGALLGDLPPQLSKEFAELNILYLTSIPFFKPEYRSDQFLSLVSRALIRRIHPPSSYLLYEGEKQREMFIVKKGRIDLFIETVSQPVATLIEGDYFGDYQLLFGTTNQLGARSQDFTEVLVLTFYAFEEVLDHPLQIDIDFRSLGGNFRKSEDKGVLDTIQHTDEFLEKIASNLSQISKAKFRNMMERSEALVKGFRISPTAPFHVLWDIMSLLATMYYATSFPLRFATKVHSGTLKLGFDWTFLVDYFFDLMFLLDIYLRINVFSYKAFVHDSGRNQVITDRILMRKHYIESRWFMFDCISNVPVDVISVFVGHLTLFRIPKLLRVSKIPAMVTKLQNDFDECLHITMNESQVSCMVMFLCSLLIIVWSSAGWNAIRTDESAVDSVYWALTTLTTVGYGDLTPTDFKETCYAIVVGAIGATFTAGIIANVTSFFHDVDISEDNIEHKKNCVKCFMENHRCPFSQVKNIQEYFDYIERDQEGINEDLLLRQAVPDHIRNNILIHLTQSMIMKCEFFADCDPGFLRQVMISMEQRFYGAQYMVLSSSMPADGMYFIKKGAVELLDPVATSENHKVLKKLETDDNFAEGCLVEHWEENPYLARAFTDSELWFLGRSKFIRLVDDFPHVRVLLRRSSTSKSSIARRGSVKLISKAIERAKRNSQIYIHPDKYLIQLWFGVILIVTLYNIIVIPFRLAFMENHELTSLWLVLDYGGDFFLIVDMIIRTSFLAYYDDTHLVIVKKDIWNHYLRSGKIKTHLLSILPTEVAIIAVPQLCPLWKLQVWSLFRINKLFRVSEVRYLIDRVETSLGKAGVRVPKNGLRVAKLISVIILSAHLVACVFYMIANFNQHSYPFEDRHNWANNEGLMDITPTCPGKEVELTTMMKRYIASLYWSMATLTTVGYGDITAHKDSAVEILFATLILVIGTAIYTMVIALLEDIVSQLDVTSSLHKLKMDKIESYVQSQVLPDALKIKIDAYYESLWRIQRGVNGKKLLRFMPDYFRAEMTLDMLSPLLHKTFFIKDCTADFIAHILDFVSYEIFLPDDVVFYEGERAQELFFIRTGEIDLLTSKNVKFKTVSECVLGESSFFGFEPHICNAKAVDVCEIFILSMKDFVKCLHDNQLIKDYVEYLQKNEKKLLSSKASLSKMIKNLKSSKMEKMLVDSDQPVIPKGVILPESQSRQLWEAYALVEIIIYTITIPYQISFSGNGISYVQFSFDLWLDCFFLLDVYARLQRFAIMREGFLISNPKEFRSIYLRSDLRLDLVSVLPVSTIGYLCNIRDGQYGLLRLFQLTRIRHFGTYLDNFVEAFNSRMNFSISTAIMRILEIFLIVVFLCHWFACMFHLLGSKKTEETWLVADDSANEPASIRYLRSFYWALYTVTTIGYGAVPVVTNLERIFSMFVMAIGAIICDAGITAILTSIISMRDQQAGANSRRIQCSKRFMQTSVINKELQERVLHFYNYADVELENIKEEEILNDFSTCLKMEVLNLFCFGPLKHSLLFEDFSDGALRSLIKVMTPYLAIPGEKLSEIGVSCEGLFVLLRGDVCCIDSSGYKSLLPPNEVIGHVATEATSRRLGLYSKYLQIDVVSMRGIKTKYGNLYIVFKSGTTCCRSAIRKGADWGETLLLKTTTGMNMLSILIKSWQRNKIHVTVGAADLPIGADSITKTHTVVVRDSHGRTIGSLKLKLSYGDLLPDQLVHNHERTAVCSGYCHLYRAELHHIDDLRSFLKLSKNPQIYDRLTGPFLEWQAIHTLNDNDCIKLGWRRPSRPSLYLQYPASSNNRSLTIRRKEIRKLTITEKDESIDSGSDSKSFCSKEFDLSEGNNKSIRKLSFRDRKKVASIHPIDCDIDSNLISSSDRNDESRKDLAPPLVYRRNSSVWSGSNKVKTATLLKSQGNEELAGFENMETEYVEDVNHERKWDMPVDLSSISLDNREGGIRNRRKSFFVEWAPCLEIDFEET